MFEPRRFISFTGMVFLLVISLYSFSSATIHDISIIDFAFVPQIDTVVQGDTVRWTNNGALPHTSTSNSGVWNSGTISPGSSFLFQFNSAGSFSYHCNFHPSMTGTIAVYRSMPAFSPGVIMILILLLVGTGVWLLRRISIAGAK